ncbi:MAG: multifunctional CCA tRNA nucleotidyl transferase/2'3'-cyclic phosphodiesterase/2'nucleotidase/phosphatase [Gammaproteobacteria bacterium]|nr:multifunctional CCA tRNA nucleotidyl transferase/2'3'-cyclic phosphodiesterase/2'nucleotidase/phosphatase [Gammaproteobacteria bacterium]MYF31113.1 multifunctional CCA tRNA nucleotidyl transferase/2'3'-cyclic phosphodiesterase/2'nucleotidase/phosphatase [Gammaproteobacteria bacterium]MYK45390.1 multifunctional CCA tRNA nucleotidyl transferase/2'3'-cyclic phosphodiesterase/2'nucleotidase/phosphatase [Gammaproteobacteria bacterium]
MTARSWIDVGGGATTYLVGGAVRDELLDRQPSEFDWVVVGATPERMLDHGFNQVGRDFPVFLEPNSGEQYALARTERRTGPGHADFVCDAAPDVTLEADLARRDLTINAMARDRDGTLIDPCDGQRDIAGRMLRHVSPAFAEDPLRVFRVARFAAQLPDFEIASETLAVMRSMVDELAALSGERVFAELRRAADSARPGRFFETLGAVGEHCWFRDIDLRATARLFGAGVFADASTALVGMGWVNAPAAVDRLYRDLRAPRQILRGAVALARHGKTLVQRDVDAQALLDALTGIDAFRQNDVTPIVLAGAEACSGRSMAGKRQLIGELSVLRVDAQPGPDYGAALRRRRVNWIAKRCPP